MEQSYKGHNITASAWELLDKTEWEPKVKVTWSEGIRERIKYPQITKYFPTHVEAEREALAFAKNWIDDGKPDF